MTSSSMLCIRLGSNAIAKTLEDAASSSRLAEAENAVGKLKEFVRRYEGIENVSGLDTNDEILNWVLDEAFHDLGSALWNCASGQYKTAATALRGALEISVIALYFQNLENDWTADGNIGLNPKFREWDRGDADTPSWKTPKANLRARSSFLGMVNTKGFDVVQQAHDHFGVLCSFTHSRTSDPTLGKYSNTSWMVGDGPRFDLDAFNLILDLVHETVSWIATLWMVSFPAMLSPSTMKGSLKLRDVQSLLRGPAPTASFDYCGALVPI
jgi:hypothetical protein